LPDAEAVAVIPARHRALPQPCGVDGSAGLPGVQDVTELSQAYRLFALGRHAEARRVISRVFEGAAQDDVTAMSCAAASLEGFIDLSQGRLASAWTRLLLSGQRLPVLRSLVLYERDELDAAWPVLLINLPTVIAGDCADALIVTCVLLSRIALSRGDPVASRHYLARLEHAAQARGCPRMRCSVWIERARVATLEGRLEAAAQALLHIGRSADWECAGVLYYSNDVDTPAIANLRLLIARGRCSEALALLPAAINDASRRGHLRRALKLRLLHAMALDGTGAQDTAFDELTRVLKVAALEGWRGTFLEEGSALAWLVQRWARACRMRIGALGIDAGFLNDLLKRLVVDDVHPRTSPPPLRETLTGREREILGLLGEGGPMRGIAHRLQLSEHTVKTHLRNIYRKLGAHGQAQASAIARALGLLDA